MYSIENLLPFDELEDKETVYSCDDKNTPVFKTIIILS
jgi:hypothetical protein